MKVSDLVGRGLTPYFKLTVPAPLGPLQSVTTKPNTTLFSSDEIQSKTSSLKITEKEGSPTMIDLTVLDDTGRLNKRYTYGLQVNVEWGLKQSKNNLLQSLMKKETAKLNEIKGMRKRGPIPCHFMNYAPSLGDGIIRSVITMRAGRFGGYIEKRKVYSNETPAQIIKEQAEALKHDVVIDFPEMDTPLTSESAIAQNYETRWQFLRRLSFRFNCKLVMQSDPPTIYFVAWQKQWDINYASARGISTSLLGGAGSENLVHYLDYGTDDGRIISGSFEQNMNSPNGSTVVMVTGPDGVTHANFQASKTEEVTVWEVNSENIKKALSKGNFKDKTALMSEVLSTPVEDLQKFIDKGYITPRKTTTAPEGSGYTGKFKIVPNPDMQVGDYIFIGSNASLIPGQFKSRYKKKPGFIEGALSAPIIEKRTLWRITAINQTIDATNYSFEIEVAR